MKFKNTWKKFWTLERRANHGFTLVELVVVIAILGILGGVGTVGYSGYIKHAAKKADQVLVGNIVRAIETGTNSTMFVNDDSFKMGKIAYPVGFIALNTTEGKVVASASGKNAPVEGECAFQQIDNVVVEVPTVKYSGCSNNESGTIYSVSIGSIRYCTEHSTAEPVIAEVGGQNYASDYTHSGLDVGYCLGHKWKPVNSQYPAGAKKVSNQNALSLEASGGMCAKVYANQNPTFAAGQTNVDVTTSGTLYDSIVAAFGNVSDLKLQYNGWVTDEGADYATFYSSANQLMSDMELLSGTLASASTNALFGGLVAGTYNNKEEVLAGVSDTIVRTYPEEGPWLEEWARAADDTWEGGRGFGLPGREYYCAARMAYNNAFASYLSVRGIEDKYVELIQKFYTQSLGDMGLPGLVNTDAFTNSESKLKGNFTRAGDDGTVFQQCADLYEEYKVSDACADNGKLFYDVMVTFNETADIARDKNNAYNGEMFAYYNSYVNEMSALYNKAQQEARGGIVIIVTVEEGKVKCDVTPSAADPRPAE